jgi:serine/threonine protein kinase
MRKLLETIGYSCVTDFYELSTPLGKGQFGLVKLGTHKKSGKQVAIKTVKKSNMKPIEVF